MEGDYIPLDISGPSEDHFVAFLRHHQNQWGLFIATRFFWEMEEVNEMCWEDMIWEGTVLTLPQDCHVSSWKSVFWEKHIVEGMGQSIPVADFLSGLPYYAGLGVQSDD